MLTLSPQNTEFKTSGFSLWFQSLQIVHANRHLLKDTHINPSSFILSVMIPSVSEVYVDLLS